MTINFWPWDNLCSGGFKLWECAIDLAVHLCQIWSIQQKLDQTHSKQQSLQEPRTGTLCPKIQGKKVLELGCGHGLPGVLCASLGMEAHFQASVSSMLIPSHFTISHKNNLVSKALESQHFVRFAWLLTLRSIVCLNCFDVMTSSPNLILTGKEVLQQTQSLLL